MNIKFPFRTAISGTLFFEKKGDQLEVLIEHAISGDVDTKKLEKVKLFEVPVSGFKSDEHLIEWAAEVALTFQTFAASALAHETLEHLSDVVYYISFQMGITSEKYSEIIKARLEEKERFLKHRFDMSGIGQGKRSEWTELTLSIALRRAIASLTPNEPKTLDKVANKLKKLYPMEAPKNGESLRKLIDRLGVDWKSIKSGEV